MFFMIDTIDIASYADGETPYSVEKNQCDLETKLQNVSGNLLNGSMKATLKTNQDKCHFLSSLDLSSKFFLPTCILEKSWCSNRQKVGF